MYTFAISIATTVLVVAIDIANIHYIYVEQYQILLKTCAAARSTGQSDKPFYSALC